MTTSTVVAFWRIVFGENIIFRCKVLSEEFHHNNIALQNIIMEYVQKIEISIHVYLLPTRVGKTKFD